MVKVFFIKEHWIEYLTEILSNHPVQYLLFTPGDLWISSTAGVARGRPGGRLPPWALCVIYPLVAVLLAASLAVVGLYGSFFSRTAVFMWLLSALSAFLTSALLLEPLKVSSDLRSTWIVIPLDLQEHPPPPFFRCVCRP